MRTFTTYSALFILLLVTACQSRMAVLYTPDQACFRYSGRTDVLPDRQVVLIGAASSVAFSVSADSCWVGLKAGPNGALHNFVSVEVDGRYRQRLRLTADSVQWIPISGSTDSARVIRIYKATEASVGDITFAGVKTSKMVQLEEEPALKIEFIGNSITCGMGVDTEEIPCGTGEWFDQHNAYWAYGPRLARAMNACFMLSSVSGIGIYRTWNMEEPSMPAVYESRYLNTDSTKRWDFSQFEPDIVSIALGTNDFSDGDTLHVRPPFSPETFVAKYIGFVEKIYAHYPNARVVLLSSPIFDPEKNTVMMQCLSRVREHFNSRNPARIIRIFEFHGIAGHGCTGHPDRNDQAQMAEQLLPFFKSMVE